MSTVLHKELALFDLDNTLIDTDSDYMWGEFLVKHHLVEESLYRAKNRELYEHYIAGTLDAVVYNEFVAGFLKPHTLAQFPLPARLPRTTGPTTNPNPVDPRYEPGISRGAGHARCASSRPTTWSRMRRSPGSTFCPAATC